MMLKEMNVIFMTVNYADEMNNKKEKTFIDLRCTYTLSPGVWYESSLIKVLNRYLQQIG